jgi:actin-related protein
MFPGYTSRVDVELRKLYVENNLKLAQNKTIKIPINIIDSPRRKYSVFIGATILSNLMNNAAGETAYWISKEEWKETGPNIVLKKCQNMLNK